MASQKKIDIVAKLKDKVGRAKSLVFADYQGLTHKQLEELKKMVKAVDAEIVVTKNTLLKRALEIGNWKLEIGSSLDGPTATLFAYNDIIAPLKALAKTIKTLKLPVIKFGIVEGQALTADQLLKLSALPAREVLLAQLVGGLKAPIYSLHRALSWNLQKFVMTLKIIENKKASSNQPSAIS